MSDAIIQIEDLKKAYANGVEALKGVDLDIRRGEIMALLGPNGAGKTTLFKTMLGLLPPQAGDVLFDGVSLTRLSRAERAKRIAYVPQAHAALFPFTVRDVVLMGRAAQVAPFSAPGRRDREVAEEALNRLGMSHLADRPYTEISGGERQMALIARALAQEPKVLVMDEPTASLDYGNQMRVLSYVRRLAGEGMSIVLSTHNPDHVFMVADRVALLHEGRLAGLGTPVEVLTPATVKQLYDIDVVMGVLPGGGFQVCSPRPDRGE
jgi:iron complex transport system ATP-binding protein